MTTKQMIKRVILVCFQDDEIKNMCSTLEESLPRRVEKNLQEIRIFKLKLSGETAHEGQGLLCPSQYTSPLNAEVHEQMSRSGGQSEARSAKFKSPRNLGTHLSTHCSRDERLSQSCPVRPLQTVLRLYLDDEVKEAGQDFFKNQPRAFYCENIDQLPK
ncbi:uncharacterized protein TNCV_2706941 [Trichonephila clavipes]|nr:uncharacterized protein TNCV_2706941 [Trichonephila clavipes]